MAETIAQHEIFFMNFGSENPESATQHAIFNLLVLQIKGEYQFNHLEYALCVGGRSKVG